MSRTRTTATLAWAIALVLTAPGTGARAQQTPEQPPAPAAQPPKPGDLEPAPPTSNPSVEHAREIHGNYDDTIGIYDAILERERTDTGALDRRIEANEQLLARYRPEHEQAAKKLRELQVRSYNEALALRRRLDAGEISKPVYERQIRRLEEEFGRQRAALEDDLRFYDEEIRAAEQRLQQLRLEREHVAAARKASGHEETRQPEPGERLLGALRKTLDELGLFSAPPNTLAPPNRCRGCLASLRGHGGH